MEKPKTEQSDYEKVPTHEEASEKPLVTAPKGFGARHYQAAILFICINVSIMLRAQLSVAIVAMTNTPKQFRTDCNITKLNTLNNNLTVDEMSNIINNINFTFEKDVARRNIFDTANATEDSCLDMSLLDEYYESKGKWNIYRTYNWSKPTQEIIMFAFFVGYTSMNIPMGLVAQRYGGKRPIMFALLASGISSLLMPWIPLLGGWKTLAACRLLLGMTQACLLPSTHTMLGKWAPISERGRLSTYVYTGSHFGTVFIFQMSGILCGSSLGWPSTFWLCGVLSLISFVLMAYYGAATPSEHPTISQEELHYILDGGTGDSSVKRKTPWRDIVKSTAVWGAVTTHCGVAMAYLFVFTEIPLYMNKILGVDIKQSGLLSSLPYIATYIMALLFGTVSDYLCNHKYLSILNIRRLANSIGTLVSGVFLIAFVFVNNTLIAIILLIISLGMQSATHVGFLINQIDLAPNFAGPLMSLGNMLSNLCALGVPVLVSNIVQDVTNQSQWRIVFIIIGGILITTNLVFVIFVKTDIQPWNNDEEDIEDTKTAEKEKC